MTDHSKELTEVEQLDADRLLPIANIARIMKCALPDHAKLSREARETVQECVSEFILFVTSEAGDRCLQEKRKTINGEDILWSMQALGFDNYVEPLRLYLSRYREFMRSDRTATARNDETPQSVLLSVQQLPTQEQPEPGQSFSVTAASVVDPQETN